MDLLSPTPPAPPPPPTAPELRPRWHPALRSLLFLVAFQIVTTIAALPLVLFLWITRRGVALSGEQLVLVYTFSAPLLFLVTHLFVRYLDRRDLASLGARWPAGGKRAALRQAVLLPLAVLGLLGLWCLLLDVLPESGIEIVGWSEDVRAAGWKGLLVLLLLAAGFLVQGSVEEWVVRGYIYRALKERWRWWAAALVSSLLFAALHAINPDFSWPGLANTFLAGLIFALLVERTGSLWGACVAHGFWNFALASLVSLPVSGIRVFHLLDVRVEGPAWLTGGGFGAEGSLLLTVLALPLVLLLWPRSRLERAAPEALSSEIPPIDAQV